MVVNRPKSVVRLWQQLTTDHQQRTLSVFVQLKDKVQRRVKPHLPLKVISDASSIRLFEFTDLFLHRCQDLAAANQRLHGRDVR